MMQNFCKNKLTDFTGFFTSTKFFWSCNMFLVAFLCVRVILCVNTKLIKFLMNLNECKLCSGVESGNVNNLISTKVFK